MNYFGITQAYRVIPELDQWLRRRVRMYYWKEWKRGRTRRRQLIRLGIDRAEVYKPGAVIGPTGLWPAAALCSALDDRWLAEWGVASLRQQWIELHYGRQNHGLDPVVVNLTGIA
jgi:RNA-directed DNA polymerase